MVKSKYIAWGLFLGTTAILNIIPKNQIILITFLFMFYFIILFDVADYALKSNFYGKPIKWRDKVYYYIFLDFIKKEEGIIKKYEKEINGLIKKLEK